MSQNSANNVQLETQLSGSFEKTELGPRTRSDPVALGFRLALQALFWLFLFSWLLMLVPQHAARAAQNGV